jgi:hypothetical protein
LYLLLQISAHFIEVGELAGVEGGGKRVLPILGGGHVLAEAAGCRAHVPAHQLVPGVRESIVESSLRAGKLAHDGDVAAEGGGEGGREGGGREGGRSERI